MKTYILWAFVAVLLLSAGPALCQDNDDDKFAQPQIDVISDVEPVEVPSPKTPKEKGQKRHPEDREPATEQALSGLDTPSPVLNEVDKSEASDVEPAQAGKKSKKKKSTEESDSGRDAPSVPVVEISESEKPPIEPVPEEYIEHLDIQLEPVEAKPEPVEIKPEPVEVKPKQSQEQVPPQPEPVVEPPKPAEVQKETPKNSQNNKPQPKPPVKEQPAQPIPQTQQEKPVVPEKPEIIEEPVQFDEIDEIPEEVPEPKPEVKPQNVQEKVPEKTPEPQKQNTPSQPTIKEVPKPEVPPVKPVDVKPAPVKEESGKGKKDKTPVHTEPEFDEEQYLNLIGEGNDYLDKYTVYSDTFYQHVERFIQEAVVPMYRHVRSNPELSLGLSTLIVMYFIHLFFRILGRLFKRKPKFVYNKEEAMSHADINNNFKKFVTELDNLKKQIAKGGSVAQVSGSGETTSTASIPQSVQNEISYIAQNLSKNEELLGKITKDRKQLDSFLFEFQKEVVESHKAIWNELYQLRKVFSQTKTSTASLRPRGEAKDDDTKSLSSNPETERRRDEQRDAAKKGTEPRSRSAAAPEGGALRSRQPLPKEKKPVLAAEPEKPASSLQNGNGPETHTPPALIQKEEEPESKPHTTQTPFGKPEVTEEVQPEVQINTNLADKAPSHNPFATSTQAVNQNTTPTTGITPNVNIPGKGIPFGVKGRAPVVKQPVIQTTFPHGNEPPAVNSGAKVEPVSEVNSGLKANTLTPVQNNMPPHHPAQSQVETQQEKSEEKSIVPETDQAQEEAKAAERLSGVDEMLAGGGDEEGNDANTGNRGLIPPMRGPGPMGMGGPPGQRKPVIPTNKALPVPGRKPGLPGANVFKGPPGNIPRAAVPTQIKQPTGQVQDTATKTGTAV